ncbi:hypothetical protein LCGC14_1676980, partial [marine sediment metagenome]
LVVLDLGTGAFPRDIEVRLPDDDGARQNALWDGSLNLSVNDEVLCFEYSGLSAWRVMGMGGNEGGEGKVRVSEVWESDFGDVALETDASGNVTINGSRTLTIPTDLIHAGDADTKWSFTDDGIEATVGGLSMLKLTEAGQDLVEIGDVAGGGDADIDFNSGQMFLQGSDGNLGIATAPGPAKVKIKQSTDSLAGGVQFTDSADLRPFGIGFITGGRWKVGTTYNASWTLVANSTDVLTFGFDGLVGIGITVPQGKVHAYDAISGFLLWEYDGLDATVRTIIPNGTGDVLYRTRFQYIMRNSAGVSASGDKFLTTPSSSAIVVGADTVTITLNADGSMTAARTAGSNTIKVALTLRWL